MPAQEPSPTAVTAFERLSTPYLLRLHAMPRWFLAVLLAAMLIAGLLIEGPIGAGLLLVLAVFLGWLAAVGWRSLDARARLLRVLVVGLLIAVAAMQIW